MGNNQSSATDDLQAHHHDHMPTEFQYYKGVCALSYWKPVRLLGEGSISDIHLVVRRDKPILVKYKHKRDPMTLAKEDKRTLRKRHEGNAPNSEKKELYVLKSIMKDHVGSERVLDEMRREIYTLSHLDHPHIVKVFEAYERRRHIYLVMEYCSGGDLRDLTFAEPTCAVTTAKVLSALNYMHSRGVVHRDIKLENIVFASNGEPKIIDFGLATKYLSQEYNTMTDRVGTLYSMAPEVLRGVYDEKCDMWSMGVVTYNLLSGNKPFWGPPRAMPWPERRKIMMERILRCDYMKMNGPSWSKISEEAKDFCSSLLQLDPKDRPTAKQALNQSSWLQKYVGGDPLKQEHHVLEWVQKYVNLANFRGPQKQEDNHQYLIRDQVRSILVWGLTDSELIELRSNVEAWDTKGTGRISIPELRDIIFSLGKSSTGGASDFSQSDGSKHEMQSSPSRNFGSAQTIVESLDKILEDVNRSACGKMKCDKIDDDRCVLTIDFNDFFARALEEKGRSSMDAIAKVCDDIDVNGTLKVPLTEVQLALENIFPGNSAAFAEKLTVEDGMVSTIQVLELARKHIAHRTRDFILSER